MHEEAVCPLTNVCKRGSGAGVSNSPQTQHERVQALLSTRHVEHGGAPRCVRSGGR